MGLVNAIRSGGILAIGSTTTLCLSPNYWLLASRKSFTFFCKLSRYLCKTKNNKIPKSSLKDSIKCSSKAISCVVVFLFYFASTQLTYISNFLCLHLQSAFNGNISVTNNDNLRTGDDARQHSKAMASLPFIPDYWPLQALSVTVINRLKVSNVDY